MRTFRLFFVKNLLTFIFPTLIPLTILGISLIMIIQTNLKNEINEHNMNMLNQAKLNLELTFDELDTLNLNLITNPAIYLNLRDILKASEYTLEQLTQLNTIRNFLDSPANAKLYIHSIYVYFDNDKHRFLSTSSGISDLNNHFDQSWFDYYLEKRDEKTFWTEARSIKQYSFEKVPTHLLSIYRKLNLTGRKSGDGIIVLNIQKSHIDSMVRNLAFLPEQQVLVIDEDNQAVIGNEYFEHLDQEILGEITNHSDDFFTIDTRAETYIISKVYSDKYGWNFVSVTPQFVLYKIPNRLKLLTTVIIMLSFLLSVILAYFLTRKNYRDIKSIVTTLDHAKKGKTHISQAPPSTDVYNYIIQRILKTFIEHNYLTVQLSERKFKMQALELLALQSQINPHFLFNTLETIYWKSVSVTGKPNEVNYMIEYLSDILKYSLDSKTSLVSLSYEIEHVKNYIEIQKIRYKDKFTFIVNYDGQHDNVKVIKLFLQPLVENALYHGIMVRDEVGLIKIEIDRLADHLHIHVKDNGVGISPEKLEDIRNVINDTRDEFTEHIGLYNTNKRLILTYGKEYGMVIKSEVGKGTEIQIRIPISD